MCAAPRETDPQSPEPIDPYFIARQPILDREQNCFAYELLFRSGPKNFFSSDDPDQASRSVISNSTFGMGLKSLTGGKRAFFNFTREVLLSGEATLLPKDSVVIEVLETVDPDPEVLAALGKLRDAGYIIAIDDFVYRESHLPLVEFADILKLDFLLTAPEERKQIIERFRSRDLTYLAEKVETQAEFEEGLALGCEYFQGFFFSEPVILQGSDVPGFKMHYLSILREITKPEMDYDAMEEVLKTDLSLSYKVLRHVNSVSFGLQREIQSIKEALIILGEREVRKLLSLVVVTSIGRDRPDQVLMQAMVRARFCEQLASRTGQSARAGDLFLLGLFSLIDTIVGRPMAEILEELPIAGEVKEALLGNENSSRHILDLVTAYERGNWGRVGAEARELGIQESESPQMYLGAVGWAQECFANEVSKDAAA